MMIYEDLSWIYQVLHLQNQHLDQSSMKMMKVEQSGLTAELHVFTIWGFPEMGVPLVIIHL